jgi:hypothetical protein
MNNVEVQPSKFHADGLWWKPAYTLFDGRTSAVWRRRMRSCIAFGLRRCGQVRIFAGALKPPDCAGCTVLAVYHDLAFSPPQTRNCQLRVRVMVGGKVLPPAGMARFCGSHIASVKSIFCLHSSLNWTYLQWLHLDVAQQQQGPRTRGCGKHSVLYTVYGGPLQKK